MQLRQQSGVSVCLLVIPLSVGCSPAEEAERQVGGVVAAVEPDLTIGLIEGDSAYLFGDITSVAADTAGHVYVGDRIGATIRVYDGSGQYLKTIARAGGGPGEIYGWPADISTGPEERLYVRDGSRITIFAPGHRSSVADSVAEIWLTPGYGNLGSMRSRVGDSLEYYYPGYLFPQDKAPRFFYLPFVDGKPTGDTLEVPPYPRIAARRRAMYRLGPGGGRLLTGLSHVPFAALPVWDVTALGTILSSDGASYRVVETDPAGDTIRVIAGPANTPRQIPPAEAADSGVSLQARLDSIPVPIDQVIGLGEGVRERQLPDVLPALIGIHVATNGAIWIERWPPEGRGDYRYFDVFSADGEFMTSYELRAPLTTDPPPFFGSEYVVGVVTDPLTDVDRVVRFHIGGQVER